MSEENEKHISSRRWLLIFFVLFAALAVVYMAINWTIDPTDYFAGYKDEEIYDADNYAREIKSVYLKRHKGEYDSVIMGGSKAGIIDPVQLSELTGRKYYNYYWNTGNFADYLRYAKFAVEECGITEITLQLSGFEVLQYDHTSAGEIYEVPAVVSGKPWEMATEFLSYLMTDVKTTVEKAMNTPDPDPYTLDVLKTGRRIWARFDKLYAEDPDKQIKTYALKNWKDKRLPDLFSGEEAESQPAYRSSAEGLKELKEYCDKHGVTLKVYIGASFLGEHYLYECEKMYDFIHSVVDTMGEVWDFSDFNELNMNPYNFYNMRHYNGIMSELQLNIMYGKDSYPGFGIKLTPDNVDDYLESRRDQFSALRKEYEKNGDVKLGGYYDATHLLTYKDGTVMPGNEKALEKKEQ